MMPREFHSVRKPTGRFRIGSGTKTIEVHFDEPKRVDSWSTRAAAWAQVLTLLVVVVGYFYTVVPAFQKERLSEEVAKLQIEREKFASEISAMNERVAQTQLVLDGMRQSRDQLKTENVALQMQQQKLLASVSAADKQRFEATRRLGSEKQKLKETNGLYLDAVRDRFVQNFEMALFPALDHDVDFAKATDQASLVREIKEEVGDPLGHLTKIVDGFSSQDTKAAQDNSGSARALRQVLSEFRRYFAERKSNIVIESVDANLWASSYFDQMSKAKAGEGQCVNAYWYGLAKSKKWDQSQLKQVRQTVAFGSEQEALFQRYCKIMAGYEVSTSFRSAWSKYKQEFIQRLFSAPKSIMNDIPMKPFPINLLYPPKFQGVWVPKDEDLKFQN